MRISLACLLALVALPAGVLAQDAPVNKQVHEVKGQLRLSVRKLVLPPGVVGVLQEYRIYNSVSLFLR